MTTRLTGNSPRALSRRGHDTRRYQLPMHSDSSPKLCECGCGQPTRISPASNKSRGLIRGQGIRFIHGHNHRGTKFSETTRLNMSDAKLGEKNPMWSGGRHISDGYVIVKHRDHPMADHMGYVLEHRLVMAQALGRTLTSAEQVHHINLDPLDNRVENLIILSRSQHMAIHRAITSGVDPFIALTERLADER